MDVKGDMCGYIPGHGISSSDSQSRASQARNYR